MPYAPQPILSPADYVVPQAMTFADATGRARLVTSALPLPVAPQPAAAGAPFSTSVTTSGRVGPFVAKANLPVWLAIDGTFVGSLRVLRGRDATVSPLPLTQGGSAQPAFVTATNEPVGDEARDGAAYWLDCSMSSGTAVVEISQ